MLNMVGALLVTAVLVVLVRRWRRADRGPAALPRAGVPGGMAVLLLLVVTVVLQVGGLHSIVLEAPWVSSMVPFALVPFLFLSTLVRARMIQSGAVG